jgi:hypothetical protein
MKQTLFFISLCLLLSLAGIPSTFASVNASTDSDTGYSFTQQYKVTSPLALNIQTSGGNISTTGTDGNTVDVAFIVSSRGKIMDITFEQLKQYAEVEITHTSSSLSIVVKRNFERNISVGFNIKTPVNTSATLNTSGGNINVNGINGSQTFRTSGGNVGLDKLSGEVTAHTSGGNISISNSPANFNASTSGGNISLENLDGILDVSTSGGNIRANDLTKGLLARTSGGNIHLNKVIGTTDVHTSGGGIDLVELSGSIKASTSGGSIRADITKLSGQLELHTSGSSIQVTMPKGLGLDLDLSAQNINTTLSNFTGTSKKDRVKGQMNGGGIPVFMSTSGGNISLEFR